MVSVITADLHAYQVFLLENAVLHHAASGATSRIPVMVRSALPKYDRGDKRNSIRQLRNQGMKIISDCIYGYTYGTSDVAHSPVKMADLKNLMDTVEVTEEDRQPGVKLLSSRMFCGRGSTQTPRKASMNGEQLFMPRCELANVPMLHKALWRKRQALLALISFLLLCSSAYAAVSGSITGIVTDQSGALIPGATISLSSAEHHTIFAATTDARGLYSFPKLAVGHYDLTVVARGFTPLRRLNLTVDADASLHLDLRVSIASQSDVVTVSAEEGAAIDTTSTHLGELTSSPGIACYAYGSLCRSKKSLDMSRTDEEP